MPEGREGVGPFGGFVDVERGRFVDVLELQRLAAARGWVEVELADPFAVGRLIPNARCLKRQLALFDLADRVVVGLVPRLAFDRDRRGQQEVGRQRVGRLFGYRGPEFDQLARVAGPPGRSKDPLVEEVTRLGVGEVEPAEFV